MKVTRLLRHAAFTLLCCAGVAAAAPQIIPLGETASTPIVASAIHDYRGAAQAITAALQLLQLPVPAYTMEVYTEPAEFEQALLKYLKLSRESARTAMGFAKAAVGSRRVLVNEPLMSPLPWPERLVTLAHEMAHTSQLALADGRSLVHNQWLVEGFAEWVAFRVVHELGSPLAQEKAKMLAQLRGARAKGGFASLAEMDTLAQWLRVRKDRGFDATYPYAYLATDFLVQRHSYDKVLAYFRLHRDSADAQANFEAAFGEGVPAFQRALDAHVEEVLK